MKKLLAFLAAVSMLLSISAAPAEAPDDGEQEWNECALAVGDYEVTAAELTDAVILQMFESALNCAGFGYEYDITEYLNIEDAADKAVFDFEDRIMIRILAEEEGILPLDDAGKQAAAEKADAAWEEYREIARSDNGMAFLPAGDYLYVDGDPEGNLTRYFASFGLTPEVLLEEAELDEADDRLMDKVTAFMADGSEDEILNYYVDWFLERMDETGVEENYDVIVQVIDDLYSRYDYGGDPGDDGSFDAYERSIMIEEDYYTLGESTIRDFEQNGWVWTQEADGTFAFELPETAAFFYARTDNGDPDGKLVMVDVMYADGLVTMYLGFVAGTGADEETEAFREYMAGVYGAEINEEGTLQARTEVSCGTLLIEAKESAVRLTLEYTGFFTQE